MRYATQDSSRFHESCASMLPNVPDAYFQALAFSGSPAQGIVAYHEAFDARA